MKTPDAKLIQTLRCLAPHTHPEWGDRDPWDVFNRLLAKMLTRKQCPPNTHMNIALRQIRSRREKWTTDQLGALPRLHSEAGGVDVDCPIIVVEFQATPVLLDGAHRINRWVAAGDGRLHEVNIHTVTGVGQFLELPPVV